MPTGSIPTTPSCRSFARPSRSTHYRADDAILSAREALRRTAPAAAITRRSPSTGRAAPIPSAAYRFINLDEWARFYGDRTFDPFAASSYFDQAIDRRDPGLLLNVKPSLSTVETGADADLATFNLRRPGPAVRSARGVGPDRPDRPSAAPLPRCRDRRRGDRKGRRTRLADRRHGAGLFERARCRPPSRSRRAGCAPKAGSASTTKAPTAPPSSSAQRLRPRTGSSSTAPQPSWRPARSRYRRPIGQRSMHSARRQRKQVADGATASATGTF